MSDLLGLLSGLNRPRLLVCAARIGLVQYNRNRRLARLLNAPLPASPRLAACRLMAMEFEMNELRRAGNASYSAARHVEILIALMAEAALLRDRTQAQENASARSSLVRAM